MTSNVDLTQLQCLSFSYVCTCWKLSSTCYTHDDIFREIFHFSFFLSLPSQWLQSWMKIIWTYIEIVYLYSKILQYQYDYQQKEGKFCSLHETVAASTRKKKKCLENFISPYSCIFFRMTAAEKIWMV